jgi:hypothetical protein
MPWNLLVLILAGLGVAPAADAQVAAPVLKWTNGGCTSWCQTGWYASPAIADLDGDGANEVVWGSYDLVALNGTSGSLRWRAANGGRVWPSPVVADLTGDGTLEVVVGRGNGTLVVHNRAGSVLWSVSPFGGPELRTLAVTDLETDGVLDIVVGRASGGSTRQVDTYDAFGRRRSGWPARRDGEAGYGWGMYNQNVTVADLDNDGDQEIVAPTDTHYITALDHNGNQLPVNPVYTNRQVWSQVGVHVDHAVDLRGWANCGVEHRPNFADSAPIVADVNGDSTPEVIVVGNVYNCGTSPYTSLYQMPFLLQRDRTRWSGSGFDWTAIPAPGPGSGPLSEDYGVIETVQPNAVAADLDGDGFQEILFPSYDGKLHAYWLDKTEHGSWPYDVPGAGIRFASEPVVADLDDDGFAEVIFTSWPEKATAGVGHLFVLSHLGQLLHSVALPSSLPAGTWNGGLGAPTLGDIDGDADLEVVVGTAHSGVVAYDLPGTPNARLLWSTGRGSRFRVGWAVLDDDRSFVDVPPWHPFRRHVETLVENGVTSGCSTSPRRYCPTAPVTRGQMSVFLLRSAEGASYTPPVCATSIFNDVPCSAPFASWINELVARSITVGCGAGNYCPSSAVTREQMAVFLLRTLEGGGYRPPPCTTPTFTDVPCSSPFEPWVSELVLRDITAGCGGGRYCPADPVERGQMAVFLVKTFLTP